MEASESFEERELAEGEDPFAGSDFGDWEQPTEVRPSQPAPTTYSEAPPLSIERAEDESITQFAETPPEPAPEPVSTPVESAPVAAQEPPSVAATPLPDVQPPPEPQTAAESVSEPVEAPAPQPQPEPEPDEDYDDDLEDDEPEDEEPDLVAAENNGEAPMPVEPKDKAGRTTKRRYLLLRVDGDGKFSRLSWHENRRGELVTSKAEGARRQTVVLAKDAEDALRFGFLASGAPPKGITMVPVAVQNFQPRTVAPIPPEPAKIRLRIS
jgi:hypothetical protein